MGATSTTRPTRAQKAHRAAGVKGWETRRAHEAERQRLEAERRAVLSERARRAAATRAENRARAAAVRQRRSEASRRAWIERKTLGPVQLEKLRETRRLDREREKYERAERRAIQTEERRRDLASIRNLGQKERGALNRATEGILAARTDRTRARQKERGKVHLDRLEALGYRADLVRKGIPESVILRVNIKSSLAVQQLAASLGVTPHSIYTMRLSPKATGGKASQAMAHQARLELSGGR